MLRFLSKRFSRSTRGAKSRTDSKASTKPGKNILPCKIILLDGSDMSVDVHVSHFFQFVFFYLSHYCFKEKITQFPKLLFLFVCSEKLLKITASFEIRNFYVKFLLFFIETKLFSTLSVVIDVKRYRLSLYFVIAIIGCAFYNNDEHRLFLAFLLYTTLFVFNFFNFGLNVYKYYVLIKHAVYY